MAKRTIEIEVYQTPDGKPACRLNPKHSCVMLYASHMGTINICKWSDDVVRYGESGFIEPNENCPVYKGGSA